jgi:hypothetical protein
MCFGEKRSGDVYTSTDLALLAAVTDRISGELLRFDDVEVVRQARLMPEGRSRPALAHHPRLAQRRSSGH